jgi:MFS family permease
MLLFGLGNFNKVLFIYRAQEIFTGAQSSSIIATSLTLLLYALFNMVRAIGEFSIGTLSDYVNRKLLLAVIGFGLFGVASLGFIFPIISYSWWMFIFACVGLSTGTVTALEKAYAASILPAEIRGTGLGLLQAIDGIGDLISSIIVGSLWNSISPTVGFLYATILSFAAMILFLIKSEKVKEKRLDCK